MKNFAFGKKIQTLRPEPETFSKQLCGACKNCTYNLSVDQVNFEVLYDVSIKFENGVVVKKRGVSKGFYNGAYSSQSKITDIPNCSKHHEHEKFFE